MLSNIPNATIKRLALYRRCFVELDEMGVKRIQSGELSQKIGIDSATIRRDFSYLGELGRQGYGYEVRVVLEAFNNLLKTEDAQSCVLIGVGNLGRALLKYFCSDKFKKRVFRTPVNLIAGFYTDESLVGQCVGELPLYHLNDMDNKDNNTQPDRLFLLFLHFLIYQNIYHIPQTENDLFENIDASDILLLQYGFQIYEQALFHHIFHNIQERKGKKKAFGSQYSMKSV